MPAQSGEQVLQRFERLRRNTECSYADGSHFDAVGSATWDEGLSRLFAVLSGFPGGVDKLDGVIYEIGDLGAGATIEDLRRTTGQVLRGLASREGRDLSPATVLDPLWWFRCGETSWFVSTFAPCYPPESSRYAFDSDETYVVFLASEAFVGRRQPGASELPLVRKESIRGAFAKAGRPYDLRLTLSPREADRIVKPVAFGEPAVAWWEETP